ncbi:MAG: hypothetical protein V8Q09_11210 [Adlercreutzia sp.]
MQPESWRRASAGRGVAAARATVTTPRAVALELLGTEEGRAFSGRAGRLVTPVEMGFIMEDMKTCGLKNRRLKEMLKFFYRNWTELAEDADGQGDWLLAGEETEVHSLLKDILDFTGGILEPEVAAMAVRYLLASPAGAGRRPAHPCARGRLPDALPRLRAPGEPVGPRLCYRDRRPRRHGAGV